MAAKANERDFQYELLLAITIIFANKSETRLPQCVCVCVQLTPSTTATRSGNSAPFLWIEKFSVRYCFAHCYSTALQTIFSQARMSLHTSRPSHGKCTARSRFRRSSLEKAKMIRVRKCSTVEVLMAERRACKDNMGITCWPE